MCLYNYNKNERTIRNYIKKGNTTKIYYAQPYCSGKKVTNENNNRMIRRRISKGTLIDGISKKFIKQIEN